MQYDHLKHLVGNLGYGAVLIILALSNMAAARPNSVSKSLTTLAPAPSDLVISQFRLGTTALETDEVIELYNRSCTNTIDLNGWTVEGSKGANAIVLKGFLVSTPIGPGQYFLLASSSFDAANPGVTDAIYDPIAGGGVDSMLGGVALFKPGTYDAVDQVGFHSDGYFEGTPITPQSTGATQGYQRRTASSMVVDTNNNIEDFLGPVDVTYHSQKLNSSGTCGIPTVNISGNAGIGGAVMKYDDQGPLSVTADANGLYEITLPANWSGTITPTKPGYSFAPHNHPYANVLSDLIDQNYGLIPTVLISGNAGAPGVTITYTGGTTITGADGRYSFSVTYPAGGNWIGTVTPSLPGATFSPPTRSYIAITTSQAAQDFIPTQSFTSNGTQDGWILETGELTNMGGILNSAKTTFLLGDNALRRQYRAILSFNTGVIPDNATITGLKLKLTRQSVTPPGFNPFVSFGGLLIDLRPGFFGTSAALQAADFQSAPALKTLGPFTTRPVGAVYTITLPIGTAAPKINKLATNGGVTQLRLRFKLDDNNDAIANTISFFSGNAAASQKPTLIITYTMP